MIYFPSERLVTSRNGSTASLSKTSLRWMQGGGPHQRISNMYQIGLGYALRILDTSTLPEILDAFAEQFITMSF
jgi:hypothetical protein